MNMKEKKKRGRPKKKETDKQRKKTKLEKKQSNLARKDTKIQISKSGIPYVRFEDTQFALLDLGLSNYTHAMLHFFHSEIVRNDIDSYLIIKLGTKFNVPRAISKYLSTGEDELIKKIRRFVFKYEEILQNTKLKGKYL